MSTSVPDSVGACITPVAATPFNIWMQTEHHHGADALVDDGINDHRES